MSENSSAVNVETIKAKLKSLWEGEVPLFQAFWLYYFIGVFVLKTLATIIQPLYGLFSILAVLWAGFMVRPIFMSAHKYEGEKIWSILAKISAILIGIAVVGQLLT